MKRITSLLLPAGDTITAADICHLNGISLPTIARRIEDGDLPKPHEASFVRYWYRSELEGLPLFSKEAE